MILIDLGNTHAKIYQNRQKININSNDIFEYLAKVDQPILLCSVVPRLNQQISERYPNVRIISSQDYSLIFDNYRKLETKGADRIVAALAALKLYGSKIIVVDIGTCVTIDVVSSRNYQSGFIYPGFAMLENLLSEKIDQLSQPIHSQEKIGTASQIYWANIYGFVGAIKAMIEKTNVDSTYQLVLTGGSIAKFKEEYNLDIIDELKQFRPIYNQDLVYTGLVELEQMFDEL